MTSDADATELKLNLISLRTAKCVCLHFSYDGKTRFYTEDIGLAGDLVQSLVQFLNIDNMNVSRNNASHCCTITAGRALDNWAAIGRVSLFMVVPSPAWASFRC